PAGDVAWTGRDLVGLAHDAVYRAAVEEALAWPRADPRWGTPPPRAGSDARPSRLRPRGGRSRDPPLSSRGGQRPDRDRAFPTVPAHRRRGTRRLHRRARGARAARGSRRLPLARAVPLLGRRARRPRPLP